MENNLFELDLIRNNLLDEVDVRDQNIELLLIKNANVPMPSLLETSSSTLTMPNLKYICINEERVENLKNFFQVLELDIEVNSYCSFGSDNNLLTGSVSFGNDQVCDTPYENFLEYLITDASQIESSFFNFSPNYNISLSDGAYTIAPQIDNLAYFNIEPPSISIEFQSDNIPIVQDFCITPNGEAKDISIDIIPIDDARPGLVSRYKMKLINKGTTNESGEVRLSFDGDKMSYHDADLLPDIIEPNLLIWNYTDLDLFEIRNSYVEFELNIPTGTNPLFGGELLVFNASINSEADIQPEDNTSEIVEVVLNSFDPNDKLCLNGAEISETQIGDYLRYRIRFENIGTANAINVVVKDEIDTLNFDPSTLKPIDSSHPFVTQIKNNIVEFIFEDIQLPFDDENNDGYVVFEVKSLDTLVPGDSLINEANIYFDFNYPILTNKAVTIIKNPTRNQDIEKAEINLLVFPNPTTNKISLSCDQRMDEIQLLNVNGTAVSTLFAKMKNNFAFDCGSLPQGTYILRCKLESGEVVSQKIFLQ